MNWEVINGITGIVSAISATVGLGYSSIPHKLDVKNETGLIRYLSIKKSMFFLIACSGWVLCCLSYLWVMEPYGSYVTNDNYQHFYGVLIAFPAIFIFVTGLNLLTETEPEKNRDSE